MPEGDEDECEEEDADGRVHDDDLVLREGVHERVHIALDFRRERKQAGRPKPGAELQTPADEEHPDGHIDRRVEEVRGQAEQPVREDALAEKADTEQKKIRERCELHDPRNLPQYLDEVTYCACSLVWVLHLRGSWNGRSG